MNKMRSEHALYIHALISQALLEKKIDLKRSIFLHDLIEENTMNYKLWLDDERFPGDNTWVIARNFSDARWYVENYGLPTFISFDHDLGSSKITGMDFCKWLCNHIMDNDLPYNGMEYSVHSANPVGAANIDSYMASFMKDYWK